MTYNINMYRDLFYELIEGGRGKTWVKQLMYGVHSPSREVWVHATPGKFRFRTPEKMQYGSKFTLVYA